MEPEYGSEIKDGTYVNSSLGKGVYYVSFLICRKMGSFSMRINLSQMAISIKNGKIKF